MVFHPAVSVITAIPISVAGLGIREGGYVFFLGLIGIREPAALAFGLVWFTIMALGALPGGLLLLVRKGRGRRSGSEVGH